MSHNRATIYSNGIADFQRLYPVKGKSTKISIPVRQEHLGDVLGSLVISGDVTIVSPPSFQPANSDDGNISIDNGNVIASLARQLSGAAVKVSVGTDSVEGKLLGLQTQQLATSGHPVDEISLVIQATDEIRRFSLREVQSLTFLDSIIQAEIDKTLNRNLREIKPNSTFIELELGTKPKTTLATIQYTIPAAAWKISYRILLNDLQQVDLHGHAIVDNNTDEDWKDFIVSVVMGQPITFTTDLAESKTPERSHVNIVQESALGSVEVEPAMLMAADSPMPQGFAGVEARHDAAPEAADVQRMSVRRQKGRARQAMAIVEESEIVETGDFCIYESANPVSIDAHRSAVIPVFQMTLDESSAILYYKESNQAERPYRAIKFKNTTEHSLNRGVCTVYDNTTFAGTCILPSTKPDEHALLAHALETGVRLRKEQRPRRNRRVGIKISDGVVYDSHYTKVQTNYRIDSSRDKDFVFVIDHDWLIGMDAKIDCQIVREGQEPVELEFEVLKHGIRIEFPLLEKDVATISVSESKVMRSRIQLADGRQHDERFRVQWLYDNIVDTDLSLSDDPKIRECLEIHKLLMEKNDQIAHAVEEIKKHEKRQERLRKNIQTGGGNQQNLRWQNDLAHAEDAIVQLEEKHVPGLESERDILRTQLDLALRSLVIEWNE